MTIRSENTSSQTGNLFVLRAPAKINLRLKVIGRRKDGYHLLSMLNTTVSLYDELQLRISPEEGVRLNVSPARAELLGSKNLAVGAAQAFFAEFAPGGGLELSLHKTIPAGAGFGGGSSDAAAVLRFLAEHFECGPQAVVEAALKIGADVPYLMRGGMCAVHGVGEEITALNAEVFHGYPCVLVMPDAELPTPAVYEAFRRAHPAVEPQRDGALEHFVSRLQGPADYGDVGLYEELLTLCENDLSEAACGLLPALKRVRETLLAPDRWVVGMSGSGCGLFVLPNSPKSPAKELAEAVKMRLSGENVQIFPCALLANSYK